ncbi:tissue-resident T-cell transcription regulator protein ZNF683 [Trichosurus vulpecula]|uniref:tissue-resident T-cell transcription regulator protein ZNF683 n=1 Tax=Trichosurus vulpecula TaxID=9337 RepID=UPI00186B251F|nr:tissue-resident T-cell transcription regulator protein ZNF683 [Trichosurus vulpecula]
MKGEPEEDTPFALYQHQTCQGQTDVGGPGTTPSLTPSLDQQQGQDDQVYLPFKEFLPGADASDPHCANWMYSTKPVSALPTLLACPQHLNLYTCDLRSNPLGSALGGPTLMPPLLLEHKTSGPILASTDGPKLAAKCLLGKMKTEGEPGALDPAMEIVQRSPSPPVSHPSPAPIPVNMKLPLRPRPLCPSCPLLLSIKPLSSLETCPFTYGPHYPLLFLPSLATPYPGGADQLMLPEGPYSLGAHSPLQLGPWPTCSSPLPAGLWPTAEARGESSSPSQGCSTGLDSEAAAGEAGRILTWGTTLLPYPLKKENGTILYKCNICAKSFRQLSNLKVHFRVHSGERPFQCPICKKSFTQLAHLQKHQLVHSRERPYQCSVCHKCFSSTSSLKTHLQLHSRAQPFLYRLCPRHGDQPIGH